MEKYSEQSLETQEEHHVLPAIRCHSLHATHMAPGKG